MGWPLMRSMPRANLKAMPQTIRNAGAFAPAQNEANGTLGKLS
jgi:hypothetical protein